MTKTLVLEIARRWAKTGGGESNGMRSMQRRDRGREEGIEVARTIAHVNHAMGLKVFHKKPKGSNSAEQELSRVNWRTEIKFLTREGSIRVLERRKEELGREVLP